MSLYFGGVNTSGQYISAGSSLVTVEPLSIVAWVKRQSVNSGTTNLAICSIATTAGKASWRLDFDGTGTLFARSINSGGSAGTARPGGGLNAMMREQWVHAGAVFTSTTSRQCFCNGMGGSVDATNIAPSGTNNTSIGSSVEQSSVFETMKGHIAELAIYNVALTQGEMFLLASGLRPNQVRPTALVSYVPGAVGTPFFDKVGRIWTPTGFVQSSPDHPPLGRKQRKKFYFTDKIVVVPPYFPIRNKIILEGDSL